MKQIDEKAFAVRRTCNLPDRKYGFMVNGMKTTIEIPDAIYRQIKARAALRGQTVRSFFLDAIKARLASESRGSRTEPGWRAVFGKGDTKDVAALQSEIDREFSRIRPEDWA